MVDESPPTLDRVLVTTPQQHQYVYELRTAKATIGRAADCGLGINDVEVSRHHAEIQSVDGRMEIRDLGSTNGTFLNEDAVGTNWVPIRRSDTITVGGHALSLTGDANLAPPIGTGDLPTPFADPSAETRVQSTPDLPVSEETRIADQTLTPTLIEVVIHDPTCLVTICEEARVETRALHSTKYSVGRDIHSGIVLSDPQASKHHATIVGHDDGTFHLIDEHSTNGTRLNGLEVDKPISLNDGDLIRIGNATLHFTADRFLNTSPPRRKRPVVVIPGFGGSELWLDDQQMWPNLRRVLKSSNAKLSQEWHADLRVGRMVREPAVIPGLAKSDSFAWVIRYLVEELGYQPDEDLIEFPYDWRKDNRENATLLVARLEQWRAQRRNATEKVTIIAHSMGGLVARAAMAFTRAADACERCIFLGTPHQGSPSALAAATSGNTTLPLRRVAEKVRGVVTSFDSFFQLLPTYAAASLENGEPFLPLQHREWLPAEFGERLDKAARFHAELGALRDEYQTTCIFGYGQKTLERLVFANAKGKFIQRKAIYSHNGDGIVGEPSAILKHAEVHPVSQHHGALFTDPDVLRRLRFELLER